MTRTRRLLTLVLWLALIGSAAQAAANKPNILVVTLVHMSAGAITAARAGAFGAPDLALAFDYDGLQWHLRSALTEIERLDVADVNGLAGRNVTFRAGAVPHFYFHSTTAYGILRMEGVPLGKRHCLGNVRTRPSNS